MSTWPHSFARLAAFGVGVLLSVDGIANLGSYPELAHLVDGTASPAFRARVLLEHFAVICGPLILVGNLLRNRYGTIATYALAMTVILAAVAIAGHPFGHLGGISYSAYTIGAVVAATAAFAVLAKCPAFDARLAGGFAVFFTMMAVFAHFLLMPMILWDHGHSWVSSTVPEWSFQRYLFEFGIGDPMGWADIGLLIIVTVLLVSLLRGCIRRTQSRAWATLALIAAVGVCVSSQVAIEFDVEPMQVLRRGLFPILPLGLLIMEFCLLDRQV